MPSSLQIRGGGNGPLYVMKAMEGVGFSISDTCFTNQWVVLKFPSRYFKVQPYNGNYKRAFILRHVSTWLRSAREKSALLRVPMTLHPLENGNKDVMLLSFNLRRVEKFIMFEAQ